MRSRSQCIILLEGLDKTGKTTTAGELAAKLLELGPVKLIHHEKPKPGEDLFRVYLKAIADADAFDGSTIIDRMHWSEEAYGRAYRKKSTLTGDAIHALDEVLRQVGGVVILKTRPPCEIFKVLDQHDQDTKSSPILLEDISWLNGCFTLRQRRKLVASVTVPFKQAIPPDFLAKAIAMRQKSLNRKGE